MLDIKIVGGLVADGVCDKAFRADVGIAGDKIAEIGDLRDTPAAQTIDAAGKIVAPGFIDMHTHSDMSLVYDRKASSKIHDGVTTEVIGNCGIGVAPVRDERRDELIAYLGTRLIGTIPVKLELPWNTMHEYLSVLEKAPPATNVAPLLAQGAVRLAEMGFSSAHPTPEQMARMKAEVQTALDEGCFGLSSGLVYMPGEYSTIDDLSELCRVMAPTGRFYVTHVRSESDDLFAAIDEAIATAQKGGVPLHISHLKLAGASVKGQTARLFERLEKARADGLDLTFDVYPYACGCTSLGACMPPWAFEGGTDKLLERLRDPEIRVRIRHDIENGLPGWQNFARSCETFENITIASAVTEKGQDLLGKTIARVAGEWGVDPYTCMYEILLQEHGRVQILNKMMRDEDVDAIVAHPDSMIGSDGQSLSTEGIMSSGKPHPRAFGTRARVLGRYVREKKLFSVEEAVKKMSSRPAKRLGLRDRGVLKAGNFADVTVFDPETVQDLATFENPKQYSAGFSAVIVNGRPALLNGCETAALSGRVLRAR